MVGLSYTTFIFSIIFVLLINSMQRYASNFKGSNIIFQNLLMAYVVIGTIYGFFWLGFIGFTIHWYTPITVLLVAFVINSLLMPLLDLVIPSSDILLSFIGLIGVPIFGFLMLNGL